MCKDGVVVNSCQVVLLQVALLLGAGGEPRVLERGLGPEPGSLDPHLASDLSSFQLLRDLYEGLVAEDGEGRIVPGLARSWTVSGDGLEWRFAIREHARDCRGRLVDAARMRDSLARARDPATRAPLAGMLEPIEQVEASSAGELRIRLSRPVALERRLLLPIAYPVDLEAIAERGGEAFRHGLAAGNGPYCLREALAQGHFLLERNPHFHAAAEVRIATVRYHVTEDPLAEARRFLAGELHLTESAPPWPLTELRRRFGERLRVAPLAGVFEIGLFLQGTPFAAQPALREALAAAIDRERLVERITGGGERPAFAFVPPELSADPTLRPHWADWPRERREAHARLLYRQAGYGPERPLRFTLLYNTSPLHRRVMLAVAAMWREVLGVEVRILNQEWRAFLARRASGVELEAFRLGWIADIGEAEEFLLRFRSDSPLNHTRFADPRFDRLLERALATQGEARRQALAAAERLLLEHMPAIPLYHLSSRRLLAPALGGFAPHPLDRHPSRWLYWRE